MILSYEELKDLLFRKKFEEHILTLEKKYKEKKVILYGAGLFTRVILDNYDLQGLNIVAVSDLKFRKEEEFYCYKGISPGKISEYNPDVILMSAYRHTEIKHSLDKNYPAIKKIPKEPILKRTFKDKINVISEILGFY